MLYDRYTKVVEAEFPRIRLHAAIPAGAPLAVVFDHYRLKRQLVSEWKRPVNLFFMAGTGMTRAVWRYHVNRLFEISESQDYGWQVVNCVALDLVNHGDSAQENAGVLGWEFDWREGSQDLIQVAKSLKLQGDNVAIGHSMGGFQVLYATLISPRIFNFVIAIEPVTHANEEYSKRFIGSTLPALSNIIQSEFKNEESYFKYFRTRSFYTKMHPEILEDFLEAEKIVNKDNTVSAKTSKEMQLITYLGGTFIFRYGLKLISMIESPVVLVVGENATWTPESSTDELRSVLQNADYIEIPKGEHLVNVENPDAIIDVILQSLSKHLEGKREKRPETSDSYAEIFGENYSQLNEEYFQRKPKL